MLQVRREAANDVASHLFEAEAAVSEAVRRVALLTVSVENARRHAGLSLLIGVDAGGSLMRSMAALGTVQGELAAAHAQFSTAQKQMGLGKIMFGEGGAKPPSDSVQPTQQHLSVAA